MAVPLGDRGVVGHLRQRDALVDLSCFELCEGQRDDVDPGAGQLHLVAERDAHLDGL